MLYVLIAISALFIGLSFLLTSRNAGTLLAGYNQLPEQEKAAINIHPYIRFFKRFHLTLGISLLMVGTVLMYYLDEKTAGWFLLVYPLVAYIYFVWKTIRSGKRIIDN